ncbi:hypothetical protein [Nocardia suismassiliense]|uniref:hypothetical protein n=1 Tax=Nocardia suismassiliense TaxID=2077092 RepID=UPI0018FF0B86|nr:hypothetical protein [Nocardia suismassiliense]
MTVPEAEVEVEALLVAVVPESVSPLAVVPVSVPPAEVTVLLSVPGAGPILAGGMSLGARC